MTKPNLPVVGKIVKTRLAEKLELESRLDAHFAQIESLGNPGSPVFMFSCKGNNGGEYTSQGLAMFRWIDGGKRSTYDAILLGKVLTPAYEYSTGCYELLFVLESDIAGKSSIDASGNVRIPLRTVHSDAVTYHERASSTFPKPSEASLEKQIWDTIRHVSAMEYYKKALGVGHLDPQLIHDLDMKFNRLSPEVVLYLSIDNTDLPKDVRRQLTKPGVDNHRRQYHHLLWNLSWTRPWAVDEKNMHQVDASNLGSLDTARSMREGRRYNGGVPKSFDEIFEYAAKNPDNAFTELQARYIKCLIPRIMDIPEPDVNSISSFDGFVPRLMGVGLDRKVVERINDIVVDAVVNLRRNYGYKLRSFPREPGKFEITPLQTGSERMYT